MKVKCPHCGYDEEAPEEYVGETAICDSCGKEFVVGAVEVPSSAFDAQGNAVIKCPHCNADNNLKREYVGRNVRCCECNGKFRIFGNSLYEEQHKGGKENDSRADYRIKVANNNGFCERKKGGTLSIQSAWSRIDDWLVKATSQKIKEVVPKDGYWEFRCPWCMELKKVKAVSEEVQIVCKQCGGKTLVKNISKEKELVCQKCGNKIGADSAFCTRCGTKLREVKSSSNEEAIPNHMTRAILVTLFCCIPGGLIALVYASSANTLSAAGKIAEARAASNSAAFWISLSFWSCVAIVACSVVSYIVLFCHVS